MTSFSPSLRPWPCHRLACALLLVFVTVAPGQTIQFSSPSYIASEGYENNLIVLTRTGPTDSAAMVEIRLRNVTAEAGVDFNLVTVATFAPGESTVALPLIVPNDGISEGVETALLELHESSAGLNLGEPKEATLTLHDKLASVRLDTSSASSIEATGAVARWTLIRSGNLSIPFTLQYETQDVSARAGQDYVATRGKLDFPAGVSHASLEVPLLNDSLTEPTETFRVGFTNATPWVSIALSPTPATASIADDDRGYGICCHDLPLVEGGGRARLSVTREGSYDFPSTVDVITRPATAEADTDFIPTTTTVAFAAGESQKSIEIPIVNDALAELREYFFVALTNAGNGIPIRTDQRQVRVTIQDDDVGFRFAQSSVTVPETARLVELEVLRASDLPGPMSVDFSSNAGTATDGADFTPVQGTLRFEPGETSQKIRVPILNDGLRENSESFQIALSNPSPGAVVASFPPAKVVIQDNDSGFSFADPGTLVTEEESGEVLVSVLRGSDAPDEISVGYFIEPATATPGADYETVRGRLVFGEFDQSRTVRVPILNDETREGMESFRVVLEEPSAGTSLSSSPRRTVNILPSDQGFALSPAVVEISEDWNVATVTVTRGTDAAGEFTVEYETNPLTATPNEDYVPVAGTLVFKQGEVSKTLEIPLLKDGVKEPDERFQVRLLRPGPGSELSALSLTTFVLHDNDLGVGFDTGGGFYVEESRPTAEVPVSLATDLLPTQPVSVDFRTEPVSVDFRTEPVTATPGEDYKPVSGTLTFQPGERTKSIQVPLLNDGRVEGNEEFRLVLSNPRGVGIRQPATLTVTIGDNEWGYRVAPAEGTDSLTFTEQNGTVPIRVVRDGDFQISSSVDWRISKVGLPGSAPGTATPGEDYLETSGRITFSPGERSKEIQLTLRSDHVVEPPETVWLVLSNSVEGVPIANAQTAITIEDDERHPLHVDANFLPAVPHARRIGWNKSLSQDWDLPVLALPDGRVVLTAPRWTVDGGEGLRIVRLLPDGALDPSFKAVSISPATPPAPATGQFATAVPVPSVLVHLPDGQLFVAGASEFLVNDQRVRFAARIRSDGQPDLAFRPRIGNDLNILNAAGLPNGEVLVLLSDMRLIKLKADGSFDPGFREIYVDATPATPLLVDGQGRIIIANTYGPMMRFLPDGSPDSRFATPYLEQLHAATLQPDDSLLLVYTGERPDRTYGLTVMRVTSEGALDPAFHLRGPTEEATPGFLFALPGSKVLTGWRLGDGSTWVERYEASGRPDDAFAPGRYSVDVSVDTWVGGTAPVALESSGNLLLYGRGLKLLGVNGQPGQGVARLQLDAPSTRIEVDARSARVIETNAVVRLTLVRTGNSSLPLTVRWETRGGTAQPGIDYEPAGGVLNFGPDESEKQVALRFFDNTAVDADRTIHLAFTTNNGVTLPDGRITLLNDELGFLPERTRLFPNGHLLLELAGYRAYQQVTVERSTRPQEWEYWEPGVTPDFRLGVLERDATSGTQAFYRAMGWNP